MVVGGGGGKRRAGGICADMQIIGTKPVAGGVPQYQRFTYLSIYNRL